MCSPTWSEVYFQLRLIGMARGLGAMPVWAASYRNIDASGASASWASAAKGDRLKHVSSAIATTGSRTRISGASWASPHRPRAAPHPQPLSLQESGKGWAGIRILFGGERLSTKGLERPVSASGCYSAGGFGDASGTLLVP